MFAALVTDGSWLAVTSATRAPEQATKVSVAPIRAASRYGYALTERWQDPLLEM
jgi:hypothetical protein